MCPGRNPTGPRMETPIPMLNDAVVYRADTSVRPCKTLRPLHTGTRSWPFPTI